MKEDETRSHACGWQFMQIGSAVFADRQHLTTILFIIAAAIHMLFVCRIVTTSADILRFPPGYGVRDFFRRVWQASIERDDLDALGIPHALNEVAGAANPAFLTIPKLPPPVGNRRARLSPAERSRMGIRLSRRDDRPV